MKGQLEIFRAGKHTAVNGSVIEFSEDHLRATVASYNPDLHEAPLVVGHPQLDSPAYGWVKGLTVEGGILTADPEQVDPAFAEMVNAGRFKKISSSFYLPDAPNNPVPGVYYLRHVGFLGGQPPAMKGLKSASFSEDEEGVIEFGDYGDQGDAGLFRWLKEWITDRFGQDGEAVQPGKASPTFAEESPQHKEDIMKTEELAAQEAALKQKEASFAEREEVLKNREIAIVHDGHVAFAESLIKAGKMLPAQKDHVVALLDFAGTQEQAIEFGEGDGKKSLTVAELFKEFLTGQPKIVDFGEHARAETELAVADFAVAPGFTVDGAALELHNKALTYQAANPGVEYMAAVKAVTGK